MLIVIAETTAPAADTCVKDTTMQNDEMRENQYSNPPNTPATMPPNEEYYRQPRQPDSRRRLGIALLVIGLVWLIAQASWIGLPTIGGGGPGSVLTSETLTGNNLEMNLGSASVTVQTWDRDDIQIEARYRGGAASDYNVEITPGSTVQVNASQQPCLFCNRDLWFQVRLPEAAAATLRTTSGDIQIENLAGAVTLSTVSGEVEVRNLSAGLTVRTTSGDIQLRNVTGPLQASSTSGTVEAHNSQLTGARVETTSGDIDLRGVSGEMRLRSISGNIEVRDATGERLDIATTSGDIQYTGALEGDADHSFGSISGNIEMQLPSDSQFVLDATTVSGDLRSEFDLRNLQSTNRALRGEAGSGGATLRLGTTSGDIRVRED